MTEDGSSEGNDLDEGADSDSLDRDTDGVDGESDSLDRDTDSGDDVQEESVMPSLIDDARNTPTDQLTRRTRTRVVRPPNRYQ